jgi:hypothetical protein
MSFIKFDLTSWLPASLKKEIIDKVVTSIADFTQKVLGEKAGEAVKQLRSDRDFQNAFYKGLKEATERFIKEYSDEMRTWYRRSPKILISGKQILSGLQF